jgi:hypothetical protein
MTGGGIGGSPIPLFSLAAPFPPLSRVRRSSGLDLGLGGGWDLDGEEGAALVR